MRTRLALGSLGAALIVFGAFRILQNSDRTNPMGLARWLIGAVVIHDGIVVPSTMVIGFAITHLFRPRLRRYVQGALVAAALVTVIAIPLIDRRGSQPAVKALERQNYGLHLGILVAILFAVAGVAYLTQVLRDRRDGVRVTKDRFPAVHDSEG